MLIRQALLWKKKIRIRTWRAWDTRKTVRQYQKEGRNNEARCCTGKCSYAGHRVSKFYFFYIKSKIIRQALLWKKISELGDAELEIQGKPWGSIRKKAGTNKCDAIQKNTHILGIRIRNSNVFISNQRQLGKLYCERKISEFGDAEIEIQGKP